MSGNPDADPQWIDEIECPLGCGFMLFDDLKDFFYCEECDEEYWPYNPDEECNDG